VSSSANSGELRSEDETWRKAVLKNDAMPMYLKNRL
jgi:hypothetical protein